jgi:hypothetical protein
VAELEACDLPSLCSEAGECEFFPLSSNPVKAKADFSWRLNFSNISTAPAPPSAQRRSTQLSSAPKQNERKVPGRELHPLKSSAFSRRTVSPTITSLSRSGARQLCAILSIIIIRLRAQIDDGLINSADGPI